jgi:hypothetical protein
LLKTKTTTSNSNVHPSLLENVTTESILKLLKFGLWVNYQIQSNKSLSAEDVIKNELKLYQHDLGIKEDIVVMK